jgi:hypothetical protein
LGTPVLFHLRVVEIGLVGHFSVKLKKTSVKLSSQCCSLGRGNEYPQTVTRAFLKDRGCL